MQVYIVINPELGWDNVVGVFDPSKVTKEELENAFPESKGYILEGKSVETSTEEYVF